MLKKIILRNFMSHTHTVIELSPGLNVLTGPNNSGKSAIISALQLLAELPVKEGDYMVRHGTHETEVTVETSEGDELTWQRTGSTIALTINGERCIRLQNDREHYLQKLHKKLKLPKVVGKEIKEPFDIHFGTQKDPIFLINKPGSHAASFFASSSDAGRLVEIRDRYKELVKSRKLERKNIHSNLENQKKIIAALDPIEEMEQSVLFIKEIYKKFPQEEQSIIQLEASVQEIDKGLIAKERQLKRVQSLQGLQIPPQMEDLHSLAAHIAALKIEIKKVASESARAKALGQLLTIPILLPAASLGADFSQLWQAIKRTSGLQKANVIYARMEKTPEMKDAEGLKGVLDSIKEFQRMIEKNKAVIGQVESMLPKPIFEDITSIKICTEELSSCAAKKQAALKAFNELDKLFAPPHYHNSVELDKQCTLLESLIKKEAQSSKIVDSLTFLRLPPVILNPMPLEHSLELFKSLMIHYQNLSQHSIQIERLLPPPNLIAIEQLTLFVENYKVSAQNVKKTAKTLQEAESALESYLVVNPACPLCGGGFSKLPVEACHG